MRACSSAQPLAELGHRAAGRFERRQPALQPGLGLGARRLRRLEPDGQRRQRRGRIGDGGGLGRLQPGLERLQAVEHRRERRVLLGVQPGQLLAELGHRALARCLERPDAGGERRQRRPGVAAGGLGLERVEPGEQALGEGLLLRVQPAQPLGELGHRPGLGLQPGERRLGRALRGGERLEPGREPRHRLAGSRALELRQPRLERTEPAQGRLGRRVLLGVQRSQLLDDRRHVALRRQPGEAAVERRRGGRLGALERVEPLAEPVEQAARLGGVADLLERAHPGAQLVEPGERGLERGVLVADQAEELGRGRLQPVLGAAGAVEPGGEIGLAVLDRRHPRLEPVRDRREVGAAGRCRLAARRSRAARDPAPPRARREGPGESEEGEAAGREPRRCFPNASMLGLDLVAAIRPTLRRNG